MELWAVVCTELHRVIGPFASIQSAYAMALSLTKPDRCVYVPVPMEFLGVAIEADSPGEVQEQLRKLNRGSGKKTEDVEYAGGQYL